jgi:hypothetical protein
MPADGRSVIHRLRHAESLRIHWVPRERGGSPILPPRRPVDSSHASELAPTVAVKRLHPRNGGARFSLGLGYAPCAAPTATLREHVVRGCGLGEHAGARRRSRFGSQRTWTSAGGISWENPRFRGPRRSSSTSSSARTFPTRSCRRPGAHPQRAPSDLHLRGPSPVGAPEVLGALARGRTR